MKINYQQYMSKKDYERFSMMIEEFLRKAFTVNIDMKAVKYLSNKETQGDQVSMEATISFPFIDEYLLKRVDEVIKHSVSDEMEKYSIKIVPTLNEDK